jgi:hypothetical protein
MDSNIMRQMMLQVLDVIAGPGNRWRTLALLFLACNYKNLPLVWHVRDWHATPPQQPQANKPLQQIRFFNGALRHSLRPKPAQEITSSGAFPLFLPVITSTHAPIAECDFNIHKSNSTYFSDLDVSRTHLISLLCSPGIPDYQRRRKSGEAEGPLLIGLGGVACFFLNEIKPYEGYELWTRVLCWDKKWVYTVTHFVKKGAVSPEGYLMKTGGGWSSWFWNKKGSATNEEKEGDVNGARKKDIFAFAISKYVFKYGRRTIPPEAVFERCGQLPPRPVNSSPPEPDTENSGLTERSMEGLTDISKESVWDFLDESLEPAQVGQERWTWGMVEKERKRGMEIAEHMLGMDKLREEFTGNAKPALGAYRDLLWA